MRPEMFLVLGTKEAELMSKRYTPEETQTIPISQEEEVGNSLTHSLCFQSGQIDTPESEKYLLIHVFNVFNYYAKTNGWI